MKPTAITQRDLIRDIVRRFRAQYSHYTADWTFADGRSPAMLLAQLEAIDLETATAEQVSAILGPSWITSGCDGCNQNVPDVVQVGQEPDYESSTANLCPACLREAVEVAVAAGIVTNGSVTP